MSLVRSIRHYRHDKSGAGPVMTEGSPSSLTDALLVLLPQPLASIKRVLQLSQMNKNLVQPKPRRGETLRWRFTIAHGRPDGQTSDSTPAEPDSHHRRKGCAFCIRVPQKTLAPLQKPIICLRGPGVRCDAVVFRNCLKRHQ